MVATVQHHSGLYSVNPNDPSSVVVNLDSVRPSVGGDDRRRFARHRNANEIMIWLGHAASSFSNSRASASLSAAMAGRESQALASARVA